MTTPRPQLDRDQIADFCRRHRIRRLAHGYAQIDLDVLWGIINVNLQEPTQKLEGKPAR